MYLSADETENDCKMSFSVKDVNQHEFVKALVVFFKYTIRGSEIGSELRFWIRNLRYPRNTAGYRATPPDGMNGMVKSLVEVVLRAMVPDPY